MDRPFFSVIIPTLNEERFLPRLLRLLSVQTTKDFEVIVVDGQSTDKTVEKAREYAYSLPRLHVVMSDKKNVGLQRNLGASRALGTYLVFFDADVQVPRTFLKDIAIVIEKKKYMLLTTWLKGDTSLYQDIMMVAVSNIAMEAANIIERPFAGGYNTIVHRSVFEQMRGYDPNVVHGEDHDFTERCYDAGIKLEILKKPRLTFSLRRFREYGYFAILQKYAKASLYGILKKPIKKAIFDYPMGGEMYKKNLKVPLGGAAKLEKSLLKSITEFLTAS